MDTTDLTVLTGTDDAGDQAWLDARITDVESGIEAVLDIARNWTQGRSLSRLHLGVSAQEYILSNVKHPLGRGVVVPLLEGSAIPLMWLKFDARGRKWMPSKRYASDEVSVGIRTLPFRKLIWKLLLMRGD
jgi:hypothetical protein